MNDLNHLLFGIYPYIAFTVFLVGSLIRYDREQYTWKTSSSQLLEKKWLRRGSLPFHIGVLAIFGGHFVGLLTPHEVWHVLGVSAPHKQIVAMAAGGIFGLLCLYGMTILLVRRLTNERVRATTAKMDIVILLMLYSQLLLGLTSIFVSAGHMDGTEMLKLMSWTQNIVTLNGSVASGYIADVHIIYKLHVFLGMSLFLVFPFSRLVHIWSVPVKYVSRSYQVVRAR
ncbi:respiratory nitrate reductase subunit gamma [Teredinibacter franksiae]|jgi:respiratory nitrate reductase gamma subunit|uniref:respiratory nitrate reductase subunit gamma n=1 Tax=Teredinibacter franksiae TaxID=2761453 RepID=UPI001628E74D|nr:respiratory nitrate reductase subunit gamma [Teredinibacter franksiae]